MPGLEQRETATMQPLDLTNDAGLIAATEYARTHDEAPSHAAQVARLAVRLFDETREMHGLDVSSERILVASALLHDLGWSTRPAAHHKGSRDIILAAPLNGFSGDEIKMIACLARYHRKAHPKKNHKVYRELSAAAQDKVLRLAAILRLADGFDRAHAATVTRLAASRAGNVLTVSVEQSPRCAIDIMGANRKKDLFEKVFGVEVVIRS